MEIEIKEINKSNIDEVLKLKVKIEQRDFIESVADCIKEAKTRKCWRIVAVYHNEDVIGFCMYGFFWEYLPFGRVWLDRIIIDENYQNKGYGKITTLKMLDRLKQEYHRNKVYLSVYEANLNAIKLYQKIGFKFINELDVNGEKVMVYNFKENKV